MKTTQNTSTLNLVKSIEALSAGNHNTAVVHGTNEISYHDLLALSVEASYLLLKASVKKGDVIVLYGEKSISYIATLLGILRIKAIFVLADSAKPKEKLLEHMKEIDAKICISFNSDAQLFDSITQEFYKFPLHTDRLNLHKLSSVQKPLTHHHHHALDKSYLTFSSGSLGKPKAILGSQQSIAHFCEWMIETFSVKPSDKVSSIASVSFDVFLREVFVALLSGAQLHLFDSKHKFNGTYLLRWLHNSEITLMNIVPSVLRHCVKHATSTPARFPKLRCVFLAGEMLYRSTIEEIRTKLNANCQFVNLYGPSETTLAKFHHVINEQETGNIIPVGRITPDSQFILEQNEVLITTSYGTHGYVNSFAPLNDTSFTVDPTTNLVWYHTGDLGYRENDELVLTGRKDNELKISGNKVNLEMLNNLLTEKNPER